MRLCARSGLRKLRPDESFHRHTSARYRLEHLLERSPVKLCDGCQLAPALVVAFVAASSATVHLHR
jgi:hypothetical protein